LFVGPFGPTGLSVTGNTGSTGSTGRTGSSGQPGSQGQQGNSGPPGLFGNPGKLIIKSSIIANNILDVKVGQDGSVSCC